MLVQKRTLLRPPRSEPSQGPYSRPADDLQKISPSPTKTARHTCHIEGMCKLLMWVTALGMAWSLWRGYNLFFAALALSYLIVCVAFFLLGEANDRSTGQTRGISRVDH